MPASANLSSCVWVFDGHIVNGGETLRSCASFSIWSPSRSLAPCQAPRLQVMVKVTTARGPLCWERQTCLKVSHGV